MKVFLKTRLIEIWQILSDESRYCCISYIYS